MLRNGALRFREMFTEQSPELVQTLHMATPTEGKIMQRTPSIIRLRKCRQTLKE